jgi:hypothetical protein
VFSVVLFARVSKVPEASAGYLHSFIPHYVAQKSK